MQDAGVNDVEGVQELFKEMVGIVWGNGLEGELDEELGCSKYDYHNKQIRFTAHGNSEKTLKTSLGDLELSIPQDRKGEIEPQLVKKNQTSLSYDIEERYCPCMSYASSVDSALFSLMITSGGSLSENLVLSMLDMANGHPLQGIRRMLTK